MQDFSDHILQRELESPPARIDLRNAFEIETVFAGSPAAAADLRPGMFLLLGNVDAQTVEPERLGVYARRSVARTKWYDPERGQIINLATRRFPFGVELRQSVDRLCRLFGDTHMSGAAERILDDVPEHFDKIAKAAARNRWSWAPKPMLWNLFRRGLVLIFRREYYWQLFHEEEIIMAAHAAENGNITRAKKLLPPNEHEIVFVRGTALAAVYYYADALIAESEGKPKEDIIGTLRNAFDWSKGGKRIGRKLEEITGEQPSYDNSFQVRPFPGDYVLLEHDPLIDTPSDTASEVSLRRTRESMREDQFVIIIMLGGYRANGFYDPMMARITALSNLIGDYFPEIHVITSYGPGGHANESWLTGEKAAKAAGLNVRVLHDPNYEASNLIPTNYSPHVVIVSQNSMIVAEGSLGIEGLIWKALNSLG